MYKVLLTKSRRHLCKGSISVDSRRNHRNEFPRCRVNEAFFNYPHLYNPIVRQIHNIYLFNYICIVLIVKDSFLSCQIIGLDSFISRSSLERNIFLSQLSMVSVNNPSG